MATRPGSLLIIHWTLRIDHWKGWNVGAGNLPTSRAGRESTHGETCKRRNCGLKRPAWLCWRPEFVAQNCKLLCRRIGCCRGQAGFRRSCSNERLAECNSAIQQSSTLRYSRARPFRAKRIQSPRTARWAVPLKSAPNEVTIIGGGRWRTRGQGPGRACRR